MKFMFSCGRAWRAMRTFALGIALSLSFVGAAQAQTIYGVGVAGTTTVTIPTTTALFTVNPTTGAATPICALAAPSTANTVSSLDGLIYYFTRETVSRLFTIDPVTCTSTFKGNTTLGNTVLRATSCPDGRMYAMASATTFFEITPSTGGTARTLTWTGLPSGGSGDFACTTNGDLYVIAEDSAGTPYNLYRATGASFANVASGSTVAANNLGDVGLAGVPNGLSEAPAGLVGCAAAPTPCLIASTGATNQTWRLNATTGAATNGGTTGHGLTDLSRSFPVNLSISKSVTPTVALQGETVVYTLTVTNPGLAVVSQITVTDILSPGIASATWSCLVGSPGASTLVSTTCGISPNGSGNINNTVSLSISGSVIYKITATLASTFTGTLTNVGQLAISSLVTNPTPQNNLATVTSTVSPATKLTISKTNGTNTVVTGQTTSYTITVANLGPGDAPGSVVKDPVAAGLFCTTASCAVIAGTAVCPIDTPTGHMVSLQGAGINLTTFNANSTVVFVVDCDVTATGQ